MSCMVRMMGLSVLGTPFMVQWILPYGVSTSCSCRCREKRSHTADLKTIAETTQQDVFSFHFNPRVKKGESWRHNPTNPLKLSGPLEPSTHADFYLSDDHFHVRVLQNHVCWRGVRSCLQTVPAGDPWVPNCHRVTKRCAALLRGLGLIPPLAQLA